MSTKDFKTSINRMKELMGYDRNLTEHSTHNGTIIATKMGADGNVYGIIKENAYIYLKKAKPNKDGKELVAENFQYLTGLANKSDYRYTSINKAEKNLDLKILAVNESVLNSDRVLLNKPSLEEERYRKETLSMREELNRFSKPSLNENSKSVIVNDECEGRKELKFGKHPRFQKPVMDIPRGKGGVDKPYGTKIGDSEPFEIEVDQDELVGMMTTIIESELKKKVH